MTSHLCNTDCLKNIFKEFLVTVTPSDEEQVHANEYIYFKIEKFSLNRVQTPISLQVSVTGTDILPLEL